MSISFTDKLAARIEKTGSALCVGLDPRPVMDDLQAVPVLLRKVVEETAPYAAAFKPNIAYFEAMGLRGLEMLEELLPDMPDDVPVVLDVKRGDIGETQKYYAQAYFERLGVDAVTLSPFMGYDTLEPFLEYEGKGVYLLTVTSNPGSSDIERRELSDGRKVYELVGDMVRRSMQEHRKTSVGMVVGLTNADSDFGAHPGRSSVDSRTGRPGRRSFQPERFRPCGASPDQRVPRYHVPESGTGLCRKGADVCRPHP